MVLYGYCQRQRNYWKIKKNLILKKKILIIGGSGFLGFNLILKLKKFKNFEITSVSRRIPFYLQNIKKVKTIKGDFSNYRSIQKKLKNRDFNIVVNLGGNIDHKNKLQTDRSHFRLCKNLVDFFLNKQISLFIQAGSSLEYGGKKTPHRENDTCKPNSIYGKSKFKSTNYLTKSGLNFVVLRLYQVYGPYQKTNRIIPLAITKLKKYSFFKASAGNQLRDFIYIDDIINLIIKIIISKKVKKGIFNVGMGKGISIKQILNKIEKIVDGGQVLYGKKKMRKDEPKILLPDIKKVKKFYKWKPKTKLQIGLKKTIKFYDKTTFS